jgi:hypothetical protein
MVIAVVTIITMGAMIVTVATTIVIITMSAIMALILVGDITLDLGWGWSVPIIVGGLIVGYELSQVDQAPVVVQQQPSTTVIQQPAPLMQNCSPWTETQHPDGTITRSRTCNQ